MVVRRESVCKQVGQALFLDVPYVLDSLVRRTDYQLNKRYELRDPGAAEPWQFRPPVAAAIPLVLTLIFALYGPTFDALCSLFVRPWWAYALLAIGGLAVLAVLWLAWVVASELWMRYHKRIERGNPKDFPWVRRLIFFVGLSLFVVVPISLIAWQIHGALLHPWAWASDGHRCLDSSVRRDAWLQFIAAISLTWFVVFVTRRPIARRVERLVGCALLISVWVGLRFLTSGSATEASHGPYQTAFGALAAVIPVVVWILVALSAPRVVRGSESTYGPLLRRALQRCELFVDNRRDPELTVDRVLYALVGAPLTQPLLLLVVPSFAAVVSGRRQLWWAWWITFAIALFVVALGSISTRWQMQITLVRRWLLTGLPRALSIAVLGLALGRLFDVDYVAYVLDAAPFGAITLTFAMLYALVWLLERTLNEPLQAELLAVLAADPATRERIQNEVVDRVRYEIDKPAIRTLVEQEGRYVQIHGVGRFAVVGILKPGTLAAPDQREAFHTYDKLELFETLAESERAHVMAPLDAGGDARALQANAAQRQKLDELLDMVHGLRRRVRTYFAGLNTAIALVLLLIFCWVRSADTGYTRRPLVLARSLPWQRSEASSESPRAKKGFDLIAKLQRQAEHRRPALLVAASGGGTRAALFATGALRGLDSTGFGDDILLLSGVSGGGVSLAYFASHLHRLAGSSQAKDASLRAAWDDYVDAMSFPYIEDVLEGAGEYRMVREQAIGQLLAESFERSFWRERNTSTPSTRVSRTFGELDIGLILNTTIASHPYSDSHLLKNLFSGISGSAERAAQLAYSRFSGGRLIFTNLNPTPFPQRGAGQGAADDFAPDIDLTYKVFQNSLVPITPAAELNANFPPVFSNIGVWEARDDGPPRKYYVTDGGVQENRGLISLLYALEGALEGWPADRGTPLPCIDIVALEASAMNFDYSQDRGISAVFSSSAGERLGSGLERQLLAAIEGHAKRLGGGCPEAGDGTTTRAVRLHYLIIPAVFTTRGGFGTHWMLPDSVRLHSPAEAQPGHFWEAAHYQDLARKEVQHLLVRCMFPANEDPPDTECARLLGGRIPRAWLGDTASCSNDPSEPPCVDGWKALREDLRTAMVQLAPR